MCLVIEYPEPLYSNVLTTEQEQSPARHICKLHVANRHIVALDKAYELSRTHNLRVFRKRKTILPVISRTYVRLAVKGISAPINRSGSCNRRAGRLVRDDKMLSDPHFGVAAVVLRIGIERVVIVHVRARLQDRTVLKM